MNSSSYRPAEKREEHFPKTGRVWGGGETPVWLSGLDRILHSLYQKNRRENENLLCLLETRGLPLFVSCVPGGRP